MAVCSKRLFLLLLFCFLAGCAERSAQTRHAANESPEGCLFPLPPGVVKVVIGDTSTHDPHYMTNSSGEVVKIPVGCGFLLPQQILIEPYLQVQDQPGIQALWDELQPCSETNEQGVTFSGVLSEQFFLNREDRLVLHTFIICEDSTVVVSTNGSIVRVGIEYRYVPPTNEVTNVTVKRPEYVRHVYSLMQDHAPEQVQKRKDFYKRIGIDLEEKLFPFGIGLRGRGSALE